MLLNPLLCNRPRHPRDRLGCPFPTSRGSVGPAAAAKVLNRDFGLWVMTSGGPDTGWHGANTRGRRRRSSGARIGGQWWRRRRQAGCRSGSSASGIMSAPDGTGKRPGTSEFWRDRTGARLRRTAANPGRRGRGPTQLDVFRQRSGRQECRDPDQLRGHLANATA